jgi:hypothetical protein
MTILRTCFLVVLTHVDYLAKTRKATHRSLNMVVYGRPEWILVRRPASSSAISNEFTTSIVTPAILRLMNTKSPIQNSSMKPQCAGILHTKLLLPFRKVYVPSVFGEICEISEDDIWLRTRWELRANPSRPVCRRLRFGHQVSYERCSGDNRARNHIVHCRHDLGTLSSVYNDVGSKAQT